jgi:hypothetical protein
MTRATVLVALAMAPPIASAQSAYGELNPASDAGTEVRLLAINVAIGAVTAAVLQAARGGPVLPALRDGAVGGTFAYVGKRVAVERWAGAGLVGREIGAVGHSMIRNASEGRGAFDQVILPLGPVRFYVQPDSASRVRVRLDLLSAVYGSMLAVSGRPLEARASLSSGTLVFTLDDETPLARNQCRVGLTIGGIVALTDLSGLATDDRNPTWAHERVHIGQFDQLFTTLSDPAETWMARRSHTFAAIKRYVDVNIVAVAVVLPMLAFDIEKLPWEREAARLTRQTFGDAPSAEQGTCRGGSGSFG